MRFRFARFVLIAGCAIVALSACVYRMDIPQGNRIDARVLAQLELGMTRNQVKFLLGSPAVVDPYHPDQWHYIVYLKKGNETEVELKRMTLWFEGDALAQVEGSLINPG